MGISKGIRINTKLPLFFLIIPYIIFSQSLSLSGSVFDEITKIPLEGVVVYIDGTTTGTITNASGKFSLELKAPKNAQIIISYLGYETIYLQASSVNSGEVLTIYLKKKLEELDTVHLQNDDWSREKKLMFFRKHFIGSSDDHKSCKILNENDIRLYYNAADRILYASSNVPIRIKNYRLGYDILYNLVDFEIRFDDMGWFDSFYFAGTTFFTEFNPKRVKKYKRKRSQFYEGSVLHFMRSLATNSLTDNGFELYYKRFKTMTDKLFRIDQKNNVAVIYPLKKNITVLFNKELRTDVILNIKKSFLIDGLGNFSHPDKIIFSGHMGSQKVARLLPLDYGL